MRLAQADRNSELWRPRRYCVEARALVSPIAPITPMIIPPAVSSTIQRPSSRSDGSASATIAMTAAATAVPHAIAVCT